ncbi:MAG TPA: O-antigen ligase family protein [Phycisphaerae bacterium]|nr:O-antigen ligase family protein [Phycisphaerae bacterium]
MYAISYQPQLSADPDEPADRPTSIGWILFVGVWLICCGAGLATALLAEQILLGIVIMAVPTAIGVFVNPTFALCCIALVLPLSGSVTFQGFLSADRVVGGLAALGILFHCKFLGQGLFVRGSPLVPMFILACWASISALWAPNKPYAFVSSLTILQLSIWGLAVWNGMAFRGNFFWPLRCYALGMLVVVTRLYVSGALNRMAGTAGSAGRVTLEGTNAQAVNPNDFASYLGAAFIVAVYLFLRDPVKWLRSLWAVCVFVFPAMILVTGARSCLAGLLAVVGMTAFTFHTMLRSRGTLIGAVVASLLLVGASYFVLNSRFAKSEGVMRIIDPKRRGRTTEGRLALIRVGLQNIIQNPLLGTGYKNYTIATRERLTIHNDVLLITAELGLFGTFLFSWFYWKLFAGSMAVQAPAEKWMVRAMAVFYLVTGLGFALFTIKGFWFFTLCGASIAHRARQVEQSRDASHLFVPEDSVVRARWIPAYPTLPFHG